MFRFLLLSLLFCTATALADLRDPTNRADYMIVTTDELIINHPWISELALWRGEHGRIPIVVPVEDVWIEFGTGAPSDTALKDFLHYARRNWQPPQLKDVFIVGFHDVVPSHVEPDSFLGSDSTWYYLSYLSDFFYSADPDSENPVPVLGIGRLPWSPEQLPVLPNFFAKVQAYEQAATAPWQSRVHLIADASDLQYNFAQNFSEPLALMIPADYTIERDYLDFPEDHEWHGDRSGVLENLEAGSFIVSYQGHGGGGVWSAQMQLVASDFDSLSNGEKLPIVMSETVYDASLTHLGTNASSLMFNPNGGAIGYFASTYAGWAFAGNCFSRTIMLTAFAESTSTLGDLWRVSEHTFVNEYPWSPGPMVPFRQVALNSMLLGDPGLRLPNRTAVADQKAMVVPTVVQLDPGYPNPFNATTQITFRLNRSADVSLKVFDILGREVKELLGGIQPAGEHVIAFNARDEASGIYFVVLQSGDVKQVQKIILMK